MARKQAEALPSRPIELRFPLDEVKSRLNERLESGRMLMQRQVTNEDQLEDLKKEYGKWNIFNVELLKQLFSTEQLANEYNSTTIGPMVVGMYHVESLGEKIGKFRDSLDTRLHRLDTIIDRSVLFAAPSGNAQAVNSQSENARYDTKKVFIVHGRDDAAKANLEAFVREVGLEPIVLHRQADEGQTVIEKFEKHSKVGYAFILLTPDEVAYLASESSKPEAERNTERRARPNVIFEWGYFVGRLGRSRVCCISTGQVVVPSDMSGLVTKRYQSSVDEVAYSIIKDLRAAGYKIS